MGLIALTRADWQPRGIYRRTFHVNPDLIAEIEETSEVLSDTGRTTVVEVNHGKTVKVEEARAEIVKNTKISRGER